MRQKLPEVEMSYLNVPGPGKYNHISMISRGLLLSTTNNSNHATFNPKNSKRFQESKSD